MQIERIKQNRVHADRPRCERVVRVRVADERNFMRIEAETREREVKNRRVGLAMPDDVRVEIKIKVIGDPG